MDSKLQAKDPLTPPPGFGQPLCGGVLRFSIMVAFLLMLGGNDGPSWPLPWSCFIPPSSLLLCSGKTVRIEQSGSTEGKEKRDLAVLVSLLPLSTAFGLIPSIPPPHGKNVVGTAVVVLVVNTAT